MNVNWQIRIYTALCSENMPQCGAQGAQRAGKIHLPARMYDTDKATLVVKYSEEFEDGALFGSSFLYVKKTGGLYECLGRRNYEHRATCK